MPTPAEENDRIAAQFRTAAVRSDAGGRRSGAIGQGSAEARRRHQLRKLLNMVIALGAIVGAATYAGFMLGGIGNGGVILMFLALVVALPVLAVFPRMRVPSLASLNEGDVRGLVARTELWLEAQRPALPAPAAQLVEGIGVKLDALGLQLESADQNAPAVAEVRKLIGEYLPGVVSAYTAIPPQLRQEQQAGRSPDEDLADSLGKISAEIDNVTRQLAAGQIDQLAVATRFLDYKYGGEVGELPKP